MYTVQLYICVPLKLKFLSTMHTSVGIILKARRKCILGQFWCKSTTAELTTYLLMIKNLLFLRKKTILNQQQK
jgi:hypothetical protein